MASDDDFFIFRRYQSLNARTILYMQDQIGLIEQQLKTIHDDIAHSNDDMKNNSFRLDACLVHRRDHLMQELTHRLYRYNKFVHVFSSIRARPKADQRQVNNLKAFRIKRAINDAEMNFIDHEHDLMPINHHPSTLLRKMLVSSRLIRLSKFMQTKLVEGFHSKSPSTHYASDEAFDHLSTYGITLMGLGMLLGPIWWLECVSDSKKRLAVISGFVVFFMVLMTLATVNRPFEVVASSAAYAAVLMVFMQIDSRR